MGHHGNAGATAPKLSNDFVRNIIGDPEADPVKARLAQEVIDLRTVVGFNEAKIKEQAAENARLERKNAELFRQCETMWQRALDLMTLLENAQTALHDAIKRGAA